MTCPAPIPSDPFDDFLEGARRLKLVADALACIETREQFDALRPLIARQVAEGRNALQAVALSLEE